MQLVFAQSLAVRYSGFTIFFNSEDNGEVADRSTSFLLDSVALPGRGGGQRVEQQPVDDVRSDILPPANKSSTRRLRMSGSGDSGDTLRSASM